MANDITGEVKRRTFAALKFPKGSPIRGELNKDSLTSEYMTSIKYNAYVHIPATKSNTAYDLTKGTRTKAEAEEWVIEQLKKHSPSTLKPLNNGKESNAKRRMGTY